MVCRIEVSANTNPSTDTISLPPRAVRNSGRICCRAAIRVPLGVGRASSKSVTTELASDDLVVTGSGLVCVLDGCVHTVKNPMIKPAADGDLISPRI
jgi:hypothetical protein